MDKLGIDLASRALGGAVVWANDEFFGMKENLITPAPPTFSPHTYNLKGQIVDGWETRRRRPGSHGVDGTDHDSAIIRLAAPGLIHGIVVDTSFFVGNYPPAASLEAACVEGYPSPRELREAQWVTLVPEQKLEGDAQNSFPVDDDALRRRRFTHVRLNNIPDGGIARLRVYGVVLPDPELTVGVQCDLAAARNGARIKAGSNGFFSPAIAALMPGESRVMGEGWETARRRDDGNDWLEVRLIGEGEPRIIEVDTANYLGNAPHRITLRGRLGEAWLPLVDARVQPDTLHRFRFDSAPAMTHLRLDTYPDGGIARLRVHGTLTPRGAAEVQAAWRASAPPIDR